MVEFKPPPSPNYVNIIFAIYWNQTSYGISMPLVLAAVKSLDSYLMDSVAYAGSSCSSPPGGQVVQAMRLRMTSSHGLNPSIKLLNYLIARGQATASVMPVHVLLK